MTKLHWIFCFSFWKRNKHIHHNRLEGLECWEEMQFMLMKICRITPCATLTILTVCSLSAAIQWLGCRAIGGWCDNISFCCRGDGGTTISTSSSTCECQIGKQSGSTLKLLFACPTGECSNWQKACKSWTRRSSQSVRD